jgi:hypothetical protein
MKLMGLISRLVPLMAKRKAKLIESILTNPIELAETKLLSILERHSHTMFGKNNNFANIRTPKQFSENVPLQDYYTMNQYWEHIHAHPEQPIITADPVIWYVQSSGTTGEPKVLPISQAGIKDFSEAANLPLMSFVNAKSGNNRVLDGSILTFAAPARHSEVNGVPVGYMTGISRELLVSGIGKRMMKPGEDVFNMTDIGEKLWAYAKYAVKENVTGLAGITTLSIAFIRRMQNEYGLSLLHEFRGTKHESRISEALSDDGKLDLNALWPNLIMFNATGIDTDPYRQWLKETLPSTSIIDTYGGSEGMYGTTLLTHTNNGIQLLPHINYFEFIPENEMEKDCPTVIPLSEVKKGHRYEIVVTNLLGYTRYRIGDMLTFLDTDPFSVHRIGRKGRVVNLAGEKLTDAHVTEGIASACRKTGAHLIDYTVVGSIEGSNAHYTIAALFRDQVNLVEFAEAFDEAVSRSNGEFKHSLEFGALGPTLAINMATSHIESVIADNHIQAKARPLSADASLLKIMGESSKAEIVDGV